ncbi:hypothetical protein [Chitinophaga tropicalis]|uniref:Uncharacterized protein n=1 Tax=Chitinophaga tropicalis TaxID=2683588 RepID=A0A7K1U0J6_9BACT|nr:hypothetical protein [Chitinophaga tropicalis]MVT07816.1 hypothetical protein [Chitinophaga tropicalis]
MARSTNFLEGIDGQVWSSTQKAISSNSIENVEAFISFFRSIIRKSVDYRKLQYFQQYIFFPSRIYIEITAKSTGSTLYSGLANTILPILPLHLKEVIWFELGFYSENAKTTDEKELLNQFYYHAFVSFNDFFYILSRKQDWALLKVALNYFQQLPNEIFDDLFQKRLALDDLKRSNVDSQNDQQIKVISKELEITGKFAEYKRRTLLALRYWLWFLYAEDLIKPEQLMDIFTELNEFRYSPDDEVADLLFFRTQDLRKYMGWENWDFTARPDGKIYYPPMASDWMTMGFLLDRIVNNNARFETIAVPTELLGSVKDLKLSFNEEANRILNDFTRWNKIFSLSNKQEFLDRLDALLNSVARVERRVIGEKERNIADAALSPQKISDFQNIVASEWKKRSVIRKLFLHFQNREDIGDSVIELKRLGPYVFLEKGKVAFIDGAYHQPIHGIERLGADVARNENSLFLTVVTKSNVQKLEGQYVCDLLLAEIESLRKDGITPTIIMVGREYLYRQNDIRSATSFDPVIPQEFIYLGLGNNFIGTFEGIPILALQNDLLVGTFIVADFASAFLMKCRTNEQWVDNELAVYVKMVTSEVVEEKYTKDPMKWKQTDDGIELTEDEAKTLIATSINIDVKTIADFFIMDAGSCRIGYIKEKTE